MKRILLKLSGESLAANKESIIDANRLKDYAEQIKSIVDSGTQVAIVIGGGNIYRGARSISTELIERVKGDQMGMLATVINSLALQSALHAIGQRSTVLTSINMSPIGEYYSKAKGIEYLNRGDVVIVAGGTSNPFFTTDTASVLRAVELEADYMLKGTRVDGIYTADPEKDANAIKYDTITYDEILAKNLKVMDLTAISLAKDNELSIRVFDMDTKGNLLKVVAGEQIGTLVKQ